MRKTRINAKSIAPMAMGMLCLAIVAVPARHLRNQAPVTKLLVTRMKQPGSPLTISQVTVDDSSDPLMPTIHCNIKNNSSKPVIAYSVKHEAVFSHRTGTVSGSVTSIPADRENPMRPSDARQVEIYGVMYGEMPQSVMLSVDLVEFTDGTRWGPDTLKNSERIDGARAGAQAERELLMKVLMTSGTEGVMRWMDSSQAEPDETLPRSTEWLDGFRGGAGWVRDRVRSKGQNLSEVEKELRRPADSIEKRR
jgi:hypothetical protein